jgi:hypothetical protein
MSDTSGVAGAQQHPVYFTKVQLDSTDDPRRIDLIRAPGSPTMPEAMSLLWHDIQSVSRTINALFATDLQKKIHFYGELHATADSGLRGSDFSIEVGRANLEDVKEEVANEFPNVRDFYWKQYLSYLIKIALVGGLIGSAIYYSASSQMWPILSRDNKGGFGAPVASLIALCWIPVGAALGVFLEFLLRMGDSDISFIQLQSINPGRWKPAQRLINTTATAYTLGALMGIGAFQIGVANILLNDFISTKPYLSIAVGFVTGMADSYVRDIIYQFRPARKADH